MIKGMKFLWDSFECRLQNSFCKLCCQIFFYLSNFYSMSNNATDPSPHSKRSQSLTQLSQFYSRIQFMELPQHEFSTDELHQLSLLSQYSIHPIFSTPQMYQFYLKLTEKYWAKFEELKSRPQREITLERQTINEQEPHQHLKENSITEIDQEKHQDKVQNTNAIEQVHVDEQNVTEATDQSLKQVQQVRLQLKVPKSYHDIKKLFVQFDDTKIDSTNPVKSKILLLNSWTSIPCKALNIVPKKPIQSPCKIDSATYLQNLKLGKNNRKDSSNIEPSKTIILGKNQSTQTKQIKHMLKVQAKTNFVEEKQKEESKLDDIEKKSIELNYLLNIITKEFFDDFSGDILKIVRENSRTVEVLCEQVVEKVKEQHNFIEIYVELIKKLTKLSLHTSEQTPKVSKKFNQLQHFLVAYLQQEFIKLISQQIAPSPANFSEYKYQKQMTGMCKFIGKLIKQHIMSKKIFKVCFWQIVYRYVQKVKEHPENDIVNEGLIEGIVTICDAMGNAELLKLIEKEKECKILQNDQVVMISRFEEMMNALVSPSDEDHVSREQSYKNLIDSVKVEEYPHILMGLMQIFGSKRMKLQFLIEQWQSKLEVLKATPVSEIDRLENTQSFKKQQTQVTEEVSGVEEDLIEIKKEIHDFINELKFLTQTQKDSKKPIDPSIKKHQTIIKQSINSKQSPETNNKTFKLLAIEFLTQFADCKHFTTVQQRVKYFLGFAKSLGLKDNVNQLLLDIICQDEIENLMIIECDYHFLVDGLCLAMVELMHKAQATLEEVEDKMKDSYDPEDEDMNEFCQKLNQKLAKMWNSELRKLSEDQVFED